MGGIGIHITKYKVSKLSFKIPPFPLLWTFLSGNKFERIKQTSSFIAPFGWTPDLLDLAGFPEDVQDKNVKTSRSPHPVWNEPQSEHEQLRKDRKPGNLIMCAVKTLGLRLTSGKKKKKKEEVRNETSVRWILEWWSEEGEERKEVALSARRIHQEPTHPDNKPIHLKRQA